MSASRPQQFARGSRSNARDPVRVALVHDWLTGMRGGEKVLEQIARFFPEAPIHTLFHFPGSVSESLERHPIVVSGLQRLPRLRTSYRSYLPLFPAAVERFDLARFDLVISTSHCVAKGVRVPNGAHLSYCHTPVRYAWDQREAYFPNDSGPVRWLRNRLLDRLQRWDRRTANRVDRYAANSEFVRQRIERFWGCPADVVHPPVDLARFTELESPGKGQTRDSRGFLLSIAALSPYKRHDLAVRAATRCGRRLIIVGDGPERAALERLASELGAASDDSEASIDFRGRVADEELERLLCEADAFVQPGIEDFGIAAVEALAAGTPVVAVGAGGVLDIVEDDVHGCLYDPELELEGLVAALRRLEAKQFCATTLRRRASQFSVERFRERWLAFLERHLDSGLFRRLDLSG